MAEAVADAGAPGIGHVGLGQQALEEANATEADLGRDAKNGGGGAGDSSEPAPTKRVRSSATVPIACRVRYIPLECRSDAQSVLNVLEEMRPLRVAFVHGGEAGQAALAEAAARFCRPTARISPGGKCSDPIRNRRRARSVCGPQSRSAGMSMVPRLSVSLRVAPVTVSVMAGPSAATDGAATRAPPITAGYSGKRSP